MFLKTRDIKSVALHILYWVIAFLIYVFLSFLTIYRYDRYLPVDQKPLLSDYIFWGVMAGLFTGLILGIIDRLLSSKISSKRSFGFIIFLKSALYIYTLFLGIIISAFFISINGSDNFFQVIDNLLIFNIPTYIFFIIAGIASNFISQINKKFGQGVMLPMFMGKYYHPKVEKRIFMFLDLKSSTSYAEKLGHIKYSELIQDCFSDLNLLVPKYKAEIYQYVGDEAVITWKMKNESDRINGIYFFFAFLGRIHKRADYYKDKFGFIPRFKAGMNLGDVTVAEVGDIKREIAFHGDVINTASRIQSLCNIYDKPLLVSENLGDRLTLPGEFEKEFIDHVSLKGKTRKVNIYSIQKIETGNRSK
jgi:adenylate cyclase